MCTSRHVTTRHAVQSIRDAIKAQRTILAGSVRLSVKSGCGSSFLSDLVCCDWLDKPGPPLLIHDCKLGSFRFLANSKLDFVSCDSSAKRRLIVFTLSFTPMCATPTPLINSNPQSIFIEISRSMPVFRTASNCWKVM